MNLRQATTLLIACAIYTVAIVSFEIFIKDTNAAMGEKR